MKNPVLNFLCLFLDRILYFMTFKPNAQESSKEDKNANSYEVSLFKKGDLLEVPRTLFVHFGIYLGDNKVAHLMPDILPAFSSDKSHIQQVVTNKRLIMGVIAKMASVRVDSVQNFAYGGTILINHMDHRVTSKPLPPEEIVKRAEKLVGVTEYSLLWDNCEHFVNDCRYGIPLSFQTDQFCETVKKIIRDRRSILLSAAIGTASVLYMGFGLCTILPNFFISFTLWMAS
ncbi:lecithin retinol acyltransferase isoform X1 [Xenopus laevis]|uniref:Lecithin retinol acyltransferase isoform X1 n=1 Tax=Xenopus laevis TaxID=8355 RepID=A0A8J1M1B8_XENLA|nr:lecithin retinol acyltransferase isoform X1 [Xenopus laevis]